MPTNDEPFKDLIDPLIERVIKRSHVIFAEYVDDPHRDSHLFSMLQSTLFSQLDNLTGVEGITAEQIGEYVLAFFMAIDEGKIKL